jgi:23S rRNA-/tRNA-specific pseudouridylate synthase
VLCQPLNPREAFVSTRPNKQKFTGRSGYTGFVFAPNFLQLDHKHKHYSAISATPFRNAWHSSLRSHDATAADAQLEYTDLDTLANTLKESYIIGETDQVQDTILSNSILQSLLSNEGFTSVEEVGCHLINAAIIATTEKDRLNRGSLSAMLNAVLASCCQKGDSGESTKYPDLALEILEQMDNMHSKDENTMVCPDLVSLSLVYYSLHQSGLHHQAQSNLLERAQKLAKKSAGSQRRKELAAERRKKPSYVSSVNLSADLQSIYGPEISVLHEDDDIVIISKPGGMVCYHNKRTSAGKLTMSRKKKSRAANNKDGGKSNDSEATKMDISLVDALLDVLPLSTLNPSARGIVHRLDRGTSGTIVLAKNDEVHLRLVALFFLRRVKKKYFALVPGRSLDDNNDLAPEGDINLPVDGRPAFSKYRVVGMYSDKTKQQPDPAVLLLEVETMTGRKHQVRVHCATGLRRPIFLDPIYSYRINTVSPKDSKLKRNQKQCGEDRNTEDTISFFIRQVPRFKEQFFLHASSITIPELEVEAKAPLPECWTDTLRQLDEMSCH